MLSFTLLRTLFDTSEYEFRLLVLGIALGGFGVSGVGLYEQA